MQNFPIIYSKNSNGSIQQWQQEVQNNQYRTISGQVDGKLVTSSWKACSGKNIGKSNETTPEEQAILEVQANYKKRLEKDYHLNIEDVDTELMFSPMLAKEYDKYKEKLIFNSLSGQPKLDGMRCVSHTGGMFSRNGKSVKSTPHIQKVLDVFHKTYPNIVLDGELYNHDLKDNFDELMSILKKSKLTLDLEKYSHDNARYFVYDLYDKSNPDMLFLDRYALLKEITTNLDFVHLVETELVNNEKDIDTLYLKYLGSGYEGLMLRSNTSYSTTRTKDLLKRKEVKTEEYLLVDVLEGTGNWAGTGKTAVLQNHDGSTFSANIAASYERCVYLLANKQEFVNKQTTVTFQAYTPSGVPRFGRVKEFARLDIV